MSENPFESPKLGGHKPGWKHHPDWQGMAWVGAMLGAPAGVLLLPVYVGVVRLVTGEFPQHSWGLMIDAAMVLALAGALVGGVVGGVPAYIRIRRSRQDR